MGYIVLIRCVLVLRGGLARVVWYPDACFSLHPDTTPFFAWALEEFGWWVWHFSRIIVSSHMVWDWLPRTSSGTNPRQNAQLGRNLEGYLEFDFLDFDTA